MARINLLPWRDQYREERKRQFLVVLAGVGVLAALVSYLWVSSVEAGIEQQKDRNQLLKTEIAALNKKVQEIRELKKRRKELLSRMKVIQDLQGTRPIIVRHFDELVRAIPDGVYLKKLNRKGKLIILEGVAESNNRVSSLMRNLDQSDWFTSPNLTSVKAASKSTEDQASAFKMSVNTSAPAEQDKKEG